MSKRSRGRPPLADTRAASRVSLRVTAAQRLQLRRVASEQRITGGVSGMLREAVTEYVADFGERGPFRRHVK